MKITNKYGLPQPVVDAVKNDGYTKGDADISVTELQDPPQMRFLKKKHDAELEEDAVDRLWSLYGQIAHGILERQNPFYRAMHEIVVSFMALFSQPKGSRGFIGESRRLFKKLKAIATGVLFNELAEKRWDMRVHGWKLSGGMDRLLLDEGTLQDYKFTTAFKVKNGQLPEEWVKQLNIYIELLRSNGKIVKKAQIVALYRDWSKLQARRESEYPQIASETFDVPIVDAEEVKSYIEERVALHQAGMQGKYEPCTREERWARPDVWAITKNGQKRATRLYESEEAAKLGLDGYGPGYTIEARQGESVRCANYCAVAKFCAQYKKENK